MDPLRRAQLTEALAFAAGDFDTMAAAARVRSQVGRRRADTLGQGDTAMTFDLRFSGLLDFAKTGVTVEALSERGRAFLAVEVGACAGVAPVSADLRKSAAAEMFDRAALLGLAAEPA